MSTQIKHVLVISVTGIGTNLHVVPMIRHLKKHLPECRITLLLRFESARLLLNKSPSIDEIMVLDYTIQKTLKQKFGIIRELRSRKFDVCFNTVPANVAEKNILSYLSGIPLRVAHAYPNKRFGDLSFLQNIKIPFEAGVHEIEQNVNLLKAVDIPVENADTSLQIWLSEEDDTWAEKFLREVDPPAEASMMIGFHPGSSMEFGMSYKRWGADKFAQLADQLMDQFGCRVILFGGPEELGLRLKIQKKMRHTAVVVEKSSIAQSAALIGKCRLFISNDSGLMHLATAMNVPTIGIFGPTDPQRTGPYGAAHRIVRSGVDCSPCWERINSRRGFSCVHDTLFCLEKISVKDVYSAAAEMLGDHREKHGI